LRRGIGLVSGEGVRIHDHQTLPQRQDCSAFAGYHNEHPYVVEGASALLGGSIQGLLLVMISSFVQATLELQSLVGGFFKRLKTLVLILRLCVSDDDQLHEAGT